MAGIPPDVHVYGLTYGLAFFFWICFYLVLAAQVLRTSLPIIYLDSSFPCIEPLTLPLYGMPLFTLVEFSEYSRG